MQLKIRIVIVGDMIPTFWKAILFSSFVVHLIENNKDQHAGSNIYLVFFSINFLIELPTHGYLV